MIPENIIYGFIYAIYNFQNRYASITRCTPVQLLEELTGYVLWQYPEVYYSNRLSRKQFGYYLPSTRKIVIYRKKIKEFTTKGVKKNGKFVKDKNLKLSYPKYIESYIEYIILLHEYYHALIHLGMHTSLFLFKTQISIRKY